MIEFQDLRRVDESLVEDSEGGGVKRLSGGRDSESHRLSGDSHGSQVGAATDVEMKDATAVDRHGVREEEEEEEEGKEGEEEERKHEAGRRKRKYSGGRSLTK